MMMTPHRQMKVGILRQNILFTSDENYSNINLTVVAAEAHHEKNLIGKPAQLNLSYSIVIQEKSFLFIYNFTKKC